MARVVGLWRRERATLLVATPNSAAALARFAALSALTASPVRVPWLRRAKGANASDGAAWATPACSPPGGNHGTNGNVASCSCNCGGAEAAARPALAAGRRLIPLRRTGGGAGLAEPLLDFMPWASTARWEIDEPPLEGREADHATNAVVPTKAVHELEDCAAELRRGPPSQVGPPREPSRRAIH